MRVGIDGSCWTNARGYGRYARELLRAMVDVSPGIEFQFFVDRWAADALEIEGSNVRVIVVEQEQAPTVAASAEGSRSVRDMLRFTRAVWAERPQVFFFPSVYTYFPLPPGQRALVAIHDAIAERFPELTLPTPRARFFWRLKVWLALQQADLVLTVSDYSASELVEALRVPRDRIRVSLEAPAAAYRPRPEAEVRSAAARYGLPEGAAWFTYVGGFNPHKHVDAIVRAHARLAAERSGSPPHLVLVGTTTSDVFHSGLERIRAAIAEEGTSSLVHWTGFVDDEELAALHTGAVALVLPSAAEGFGLPAVEAAACGTPVIATRSSPLPQILDGGGVFVTAGDVDEIRVGMTRLLNDNDHRTVMGQRARARASALDWRVSARRTVEALSEAAGEAPPADPAGGAP